MVAPRLSILLALLVVALSGCGEKEVTVLPPPEGSGGAADDAGTEVPRGWRLHEDSRGGFTIALPRSWTARRSGDATRLRAGDGTLVASLQADRSEDGRELAPDEYALTTLQALPGYRELEAHVGEPPASPLEAARVAGTGTRAESRGRQHVSVTALQDPGRVTFTAVAFSEPGARRARRTLDRALATLRASRS